MLSHNTPPSTYPIRWPPKHMYEQGGLMKTAFLSSMLQLGKSREEPYRQVDAKVMIKLYLTCIITLGSQKIL
jgi:hypothetical protein